MNENTTLAIEILGAAFKAAELINQKDKHLGKLAYRKLNALKNNPTLYKIITASEDIVFIAQGLNIK